MTLGQWSVPAATGQYACPQRLGCNQAVITHQAVERELADLKKKIADDQILREEQDRRMLEMEGLLANGQSVTALARERATVKRLQRIDIRQRQSMDRLVEENYQLRQILQTNGYDMLAVENILNDRIKPKEDMT